MDKTAVVDARYGARSLTRRRNVEEGKERGGSGRVDPYENAL